MANTLMFEVGIKSAQDQLDKIKQEFTKANGDLQKLLTLKVSIDGLDTATKVLSQIGDTTALRNLRNEVAALNREFAVMSKGAGGTGDIAGRGIAADIERTSQSIERYTAKIRELTEQRSRLVGGTRNSNYQTLTGEIENYTLRLEGAKRKLEELNEQKNKPIASDSFRNATQEAKTFEDALGRIEKAIGGLKGGIPINLDTSKFGPLTDQIQKLAGETAGLIGELKTLSQVQSQPTNNEAIKTQTKDVENLAKAKDKLTESNKKAADSQASDESTNKVTNTYERYLRLLLEIENQMAAIGKIQLFGEQSGFSPTILKKAVDEFEKLKTVVDATIKGKPIAEGLTIPMTPEQLSQFVAQFSLLKTAYKDIVSEADKFNKQSERDFANAQKTVHSEIDKTISKLKALDESIKRGEASGRDMSVLSDAQSKLKGQLSILQKMTNSDYADSKIVEKRISSIRQLREDTENLRKVEEKLTSAREKLNKAKDKDDTKRLNDEIKSLNEAWIKYNELTAKIKELESLRDRGIKANIDITQIDSAIARYHDLKVAMMEIINNDGRNLRGNLTSQVWGDHNTKKSMQDAVADAKSYTQSLNDVEKRMRTAATAAEGLGKRIDALEARKVDFKGLDTTRFDEAVQRIKAIRAELDSFAKTGISSYGKNPNEIVRNMGLASAQKEVRDATAQLNNQLKQNERDTKAAANAANQLSLEEQKLAHAIQGSTASLKGQSQVLSDLKMMATQYLSVWGAQSFIHNIIEIGGQLEKQRLSISAILQDAAHGEDLFDKIKRLAVQSPFGVVELDQFTKQLSAYGFKYNELYDMTKRLADISAGAGTEVSRLALALGHVRAEGALSGYTLRQFAMNNIPMVSELARKLSEVEGHLVTTAEVRKRVSNKEIGYKDVEDVIKKLTNEGGMFYRMQETISESVQARFKNLRDSFDIMYGEIAKSSIGDVLKDTAGILTQISRNWKSFIPILQASGLAFAAYRVSLLATNLTMGKNTASVYKNIMAQKQKLAADLEQVSIYKALNPAQKQIIANQNMLTASDLRAAMSSGAMTKAEALKLVALRKLTIEEAAAAVNMGLFSEAEVMAARNSSLLVTRIKLLGTTLKTSLLSGLTMVFNGWTAFFALLTAGMSFYQKQEQYNEDRAARIDELWLRSREGQRNLGEMVSTYKVGMSASLDDDGLRQAIGDLKEKLKDYVPDVNKIFNEAFAVDNSGAYRKNVKSLAEQYEVLANALEKTEKAYRTLTTIRISVDDAIESTQVKENLFGYEFNNPFDNNVIENIKKYADAFNEADKSLLTFMRDYHDDVQRGLKDAGLNFLSTDLEGMEKAVKNLKFDFEDTDNAWWKFKRSLDSNPEALDAFSNYNESMTSLKKQWNETSNDIMTMGNRLFKNLTTRWGKDVNSWTTEQKMAVYMVFDDIIGKEMEAAGVAEEEQKKIRSLFMEPFGIEFRTETEAAYEEINELKEYLESITNKAWIVKLKVESSDSVDIIDKARKERKSAKEALEELTKDIKKDKNLKQFIKNVEERGDTSMDMAKNAAEKQMLKDWLKKRNEKKLAEETLDAFHADYETEKDKRKNKGRTSGEDKEAKRLREIAKLYKDAYDWYKKYEKQVGESSALNKVQRQFQPLFDEFNKEWNTNLRLDSIPFYKMNMEGLLDQAMGMYKTKEHRNNYMVDAIKAFRDAISDVDYSEAERKMDEYASKVKSQLDSLTRAWDIFNSVREATGNVELAVRLSGADYQAGQTRNFADALKQKIEQDFASAGSVGIPFDINLDDKEIENRIKEVIPRGSEEQIKGFVEEYKKWRDLQRDVYKQGISTISQLLGSAQDYQTSVDKINTSLAAQKETIDSMEKPDGMSDDEWAAVKARAKALADAKAQNDIFKLSTEYINLMNYSLGMTAESIKTAADACKNELGKNLKDNLISAEQYAVEMAKIEKIIRDFKGNGLFGKNSDLSSFIKGGTLGVINRYTDQLAARRTELANQGKTEEEIENDETVKRLKKLRESLESFANGMNDFASVVDFAAGILGGFGDAARQLSEMFDALGNESASRTWSDISDTIGAVTSSLQSISNAAKSAANGDIGGVVSGVVGTITSPITAFAQLHDKKRERQIEDLKKEVSKIDNTLNLIKSLRERTLGYDGGDLRRQMAAQYQSQMNSRNFLGVTIDMNPSVSAMYEYYSRGGLSGNGYKQELEALKKQREMYQEMYETEEDKKKSSSEALEEYKQKMAELDMTILNFAQDLADELFGIDLKGWADQIGDALMTAFENGEDAAKAFKDTVQDIMRQVLRKMLSLGIIQPMMERLQKRLFGENGEGGSFDATNPEGTIDAAMRDVAEFFGEGGEGQKMIEATQTFYNRWEDFMRSQGLTLDKEDSSRSTGSGIKGITEQTADLLASYINAIRADVSVDRAMIAQYFPLYYSAMTSGNASLRNIENHTAAIMRSNDAIMSSNAEVRDILRRVTQGGDRVRVS